MALVMQSGRGGPATGQPVELALKVIVRGPVSRHPPRCERLWPSGKALGW